MGVIKAWFLKHFSDPQVILLGGLLLAAFFLFLFFGGMLAPVIAAVVIAYLLEGPVGHLEKKRIPRLAAILIVVNLFMLFFVAVLFLLLPRLSQQTAQLVQQIPDMIANGQKQLMRLPERYPDLFSEEQIKQLFQTVTSEMTRAGEHVITVSMASIKGLIQVLIYLVLVPLLVFFFLKDKVPILTWAKRFLPRDRPLISRIWVEVDRQIGNYVRGKFVEILIVGFVTYVTFLLLDLKYGLLLAVFVGLSVLIPYIGATIMYIPILLMAFFQWGIGTELLWVLVAYSVIQLLDGNLLAPLLLSGVTNLHPVAVIVAVLVFGGLWGFWGVFFAIPLATLVNAILKAWPSLQEDNGALKKRPDDGKTAPEAVKPEIGE